MDSQLLVNAKTGQRAASPGPQFGFAGAAVVNPQISSQILGRGMSKRKQFKHQHGRGSAEGRRRTEPGPARHDASAHGQADDLDGGPPPHRQQEYHGKSSSAVWIYGTHPVTEILGNKYRIIRRLVSISDGQKQLAGEFASLISMRGQPLVPEALDRQAFERLLPAGSVHQGIAVLVEPLVPPDLFEICDAAEFPGRPCC